MTRPTPKVARLAEEPVAPVPTDLAEDPGDESIYSTSYRTRVGVVVRDMPTGIPPATDPTPRGVVPTPGG